MERDIERDRKIQLEMTEIPSNETKNQKQYNLSLIASKLNEAFEKYKLYMKRH